MQKVKLPKGKYVVAVSGGVDSMALLDMLRRRPELELVVAHVNHGIRTDAGEDERTTRLFCMSHNISYISKKLDLGIGASEETARKARYDFLQHCRITEHADAIVTAHHQDDLLETVIINLLRGTGWRGLAPFNQPGLLRPLIEVTKKELVAYAKAHNVPWREDSTNADQTYLRNYVRLTIIPAMDAKDAKWRTLFLQQVRKQQILRRTIEDELAKMLNGIAADTTPKQLSLPRYHLIMLPRKVAYELLQTTFRRSLGKSLVYDMTQAVLLFAKVARVGKRMPIATDWQVRATKTMLIVEHHPSVVS